MSRCGVIIPDTRNQGEINLYCKSWDFHGWTAVHRNRRSFSRSHSCAMGHSTLKQIPSLVYFSKCGDPEGTDIASFLGWWMLWVVSGLLGGDWSHLGCPCTMEILNANGQHYNTLLYLSTITGLAGKEKKRKKIGWPCWLSCWEIRDIRDIFQCCCWLLEEVIQCRRVKATCGSPRNLSILFLLSGRSEHICFASNILLRLSLCHSFYLKLISVFNILKPSVRTAIQ